MEGVKNGGSGGYWSIKSWPIQLGSLRHRCGGLGSHHLGIGNALQRWSYPWCSRSAVETSDVVGAVNRSGSSCRHDQLRVDSAKILAPLLRLHLGFGFDFRARIGRQGEWCTALARSWAPKGSTIGVCKDRNGSALGFLPFRSSARDKIFLAWFLHAFSNRRLGSWVDHASAGFRDHLSLWCSGCNDDVSCRRQHALAFADRRFGDIPILPTRLSRSGTYPSSYFLSRRRGKCERQRVPTLARHACFRRRRGGWSRFGKRSSTDAFSSGGTHRLHLFRNWRGTRSRFHSRDCPVLSTLVRRGRLEIEGSAKPLSFSAGYGNLADDHASGHYQRRSGYRMHAHERDVSTIHKLRRFQLDGDLRHDRVDFIRISGMGPSGLGEVKRVMKFSTLN